MSPISRPRYARLIQKTKRKTNMEGLKLALQNLKNQAVDFIARVDEFDVGIAAEKKASFDEGFAAGAASVGSDKIYSQAELDEKIAPLMTEIEQLKVEIVTLKGEVSSMPEKLEMAKGEAVEKFKAELLEKYTAEQSAESESEKKFAELLAPAVVAEKPVE